MKKLNFYPYLLLSMAFSVMLSLCRYYISGRVTYVFLFWNLILAFVPFFVSELMLRVDLKKRKSFFVVLLFFWLLFFPNSPYIMTDLFHLKPKTGAPFWYDLMLLLSYSFNGFFLGFLSLMTVEKVATQVYGNTISKVVTFVSLVACSVGVYVGRYLRWNSWDVFTKPFSLLQELQDQDFYPIQDSEILQFTLVFSAFLVLNYLVLRSIASRPLN
jgi:uncharacterized membrane protein